MTRFHAGRSRLTVIPAETMIAVWVLFSGIFGLLHFGIIDPLAALLPWWLAQTFNASAAIAGICLLVGVKKGSFPVEAVGLILLAMVVMGRLVVFVAYLGFHTSALSTVVFDSAVWWFCAVRLRTLLHGQTVVLIKMEPPQ
jgi:hypothetical protein